MSQLTYDAYELQIADALGVPPERVGIYYTLADDRSIAPSTWDAWLLDESGMRCMFLGRSQFGRHAAEAEVLRNASRLREQIREQQKGVAQ